MDCARRVKGIRDAEAGGRRGTAGRIRQRVKCVAEGGIRVEGEATGRDRDSLPCPAERIGAIEHQLAGTQLGQRITSGSIVDVSTDGEGAGRDRKGTVGLQRHHASAEVIGVGAGEGKAAVPLLGVDARVDEGRTAGVVEGHARGELQHARAEGGGATDVDRTSIEAETSGTDAGAIESQHAGAGLGNSGRERRVAIDRKRGAVSSAAGHRPSLPGSGSQRRRNGHRTCVGLNSDTVVRIARRNGQTAGGTRSDGESHHAGRRRSEGEAVHRQRSVEGGGETRSRRVARAEDETFQGRGRGSRVDGARRVLRPIRGEVPGCAGRALKVAENFFADRQIKRGIAARKDGLQLISASGRLGGTAQGTDQPVGASEIEAAGGSKQRIALIAEGDAAERVEVDRHRGSQRRGCVEHERVVDAERTDVQAKRRTIREIKDLGGQCDRRAIGQAQRGCVSNVDRANHIARGEALLQGALGDGDGASTADIDDSGDFEGTRADLRDGRISTSDAARDRDVARTREGERARASGHRRGVAEGKRVEVRLDRRVGIQGHRAAEGVGA